MQEKINEFIEYFPTISHFEAEYIKKIVLWDDEKKSAFLLAKQMFEDMHVKDKILCASCKKTLKARRK